MAGTPRLWCIAARFRKWVAWAIPPCGRKRGRMKSENRRRFRVSTTDGSSSAGNASDRDHSMGDLLETRFDEKPIWIDLYENLRDSAFPQKLPPLELTSTPVPMLDPMAVKTNPWAIGTATAANGGLLALLILMGLQSTIHKLPLQPGPRHPDQGFHALCTTEGTERSWRRRRRVERAYRPDHWQNAEAGDDADCFAAGFAAR